MKETVTDAISQTFTSITVYQQEKSGQGWSVENNNSQGWSVGTVVFKD